jgi:hypothetical protein
VAGELAGLAPGVSEAAALVRGSDSAASTATQPQVLHRKRRRSAGPGITTRAKRTSSSDDNDTKSARSACCTNETATVGGQVEQVAPTLADLELGSGTWLGTTERQKLPRLDLLRVCDPTASFGKALGGLRISWVSLSVDDARCSTLCTRRGRWHKRLGTSLGVRISTASVTLSRAQHSQQITRDCSRGTKAVSLLSSISRHNRCCATAK